MNSDGGLFGELHHIEINVSDLAKSSEFWSWLLEMLGYVKFQEWEQGVSFRRGHIYIVFVQTRSKYRDTCYHRCRTGLNHLAFHAETSAQVDEIAAKLKQRGITILYEDRHPYAAGRENYTVFFEDPDRIKVEVVAPNVSRL